MASATSANPSAGASPAAAAATAPTPRILGASFIPRTRLVVPDVTQCSESMAFTRATTVLGQSPPASTRIAGTPASAAADPGARTTGSSRSTHTQYRLKRRNATPTSGALAVMRTSAASGDTASGTAIVAATALHRTPAAPPAAIPAPSRPPTSACVVDTGSPVRVATTSHPSAPSATAPSRSGPARSRARPAPRTPSRARATRRRRAPRPRQSTPCPRRAPAAAWSPPPPRAWPPPSTRRSRRSRRRRRASGPAAARRPSAAASVRAAARIARAFLPGLEDRDHPLVGGPGELRHRVGAHLVGLVAGKQMALLAHERLPGPKIHGAVPPVHAPRAFGVLEPLDGDRKERIALDVLPVRLLEDREPVEPGALEPGEELFRRQRAHQAFPPQLGIDLQVGRHLGLAHDVGDHDAAVVLQDPPHLLEHPRLVGGEVHHAVRGDEIHRVGRDGDLLEVALAELDHVVAQRGGHLGPVLVRHGEHRVGHVHADGLASRPHELRRDEHVN